MSRHSSYDEQDQQYYQEDQGNHLPYDDDVEDDDELGHAQLFVLIEEGMPRNENRILNSLEEAQRKQLIEQTWEQVRKWLWKHQDLEERSAAASVRGNNDATCLHNVCKLSHPPADIVQALLEAAPETVTWTDSHGWLPLHHACANGSTGEVLRILTEAYPEGNTKQDSQNRTPLHFYLTQRSDNPNAMAQNMIFLSQTGAAKLSDLGGMLPMHYACAYGVSPAVLEVLADAYPESIIAKEKKGRTPLHLCMVNAHRNASPGVIRFLLDQQPMLMGGTPLVNMRDNEGYLPLHLLALGLRGNKSDDPTEKTNVSDCLRMYLEAKPEAVDFLTALQDLPDWLQDVAVVTSHVRNILNQKIVNRLCTGFMIFDFYALMVIIIFFEIATREFIDRRLTEDATGIPYEGNTITYSIILILVGGTWFLYREVLQVWSLWTIGSFSSWFFDATNWLDMAVITTTFYYGTVMALDSWLVSREYFRNGTAVTKGILWCAVIYFVKSTKVEFAVFVGGVFYVVKKLAPFLMAVLVILLAFATMFFIVYMEGDVCNPSSPTAAPTLSPRDGFEGVPGYAVEDCGFPHCTLGGSFLKVYTMMMGEIGDETRYEDKLIAQIFYVMYAFLVVILLSNVLIAIVTDSYEIIQNDRAAIVFWSNRLDFVAEMDAINYGFQKRLAYVSGNKKKKRGHAQESPGGAAMINYDGNPRQEDDFLFNAWKSLVQLFDQSLYDDIDLLSPQKVDFWCYFFFRFAAFILIPIWILVGLLTAGWLWPPQIREFLLVQKKPPTSRSDIEKAKLAQLKAIQADVRNLKSEVQIEMANDREEMDRLKNEIVTVQTEVMSDLQQMRDLMTTLLDMGRNR